MNWCCAVMARQIEHACACEQVDGLHDCPDRLITFIPRFQEYGLLIHNGGSSYSVIAFCPWCGAALPASQRDQWFDELEDRGITDADDAPPDMLTTEWLQR